jgi:hypothetical protein
MGQFRSAGVLSRDVSLGHQSAAHPVRQTGYTFAGRRMAATPRAFSACAADWRAVLFKVDVAPNFYPGAIGI